MSTSTLMPISPVGTARLIGLSGVLLALIGGALLWPFVLRPARPHRVVAERQQPKLVALNTVHNQHLKVGRGTVGVLIPKEFPIPTLELDTHPDPRIDKEFWSSEESRGAVIVTVWKLQGLVKTKSDVWSLVKGLRNDTLATLQVAKRWERTPVVPQRLAMEYRTQLMANGYVMQVRYIADSTQVIDLRFITKDPADFETPEVKAFFEQVEFYSR